MGIEIAADQIASAFLSDGYELGVVLHRLATCDDEDLEKVIEQAACGAQPFGGEVASFLREIAAKIEENTDG